MTDVMIDLETLSTENNAAILTIGAIKFNRNTPIPPDLKDCDTFYRRITLQSCKTLGLHCCSTTELWWSNQSHEARHEAFEHPDRISLKKALIDMTIWLRGMKHIWSHGDDFDCIILGNAYKRCDLQVPWKFWNTRDTRTLYDLANITMADLPQDNAHHALYDCHRQIVGVHQSLENLNL